MRKEAIVFALAAALAGCSKPTPGRSDNGTAPGAANAAAAGNAAAGPAAAGNAAAATGAGGNGSAAMTPLNPGEWEMAAEAKISGLPPEVAKMMSSHKTVHRYCVTPEEAAKPKSSTFTGKEDKGCKGEQPSFAGGRIHAALECTDPRGAHTTVAMDGQYGGDSYDISMRVNAEHQGRSTQMESHVVGHRVSPTCSAAAKGPRGDDSSE